MREEQIVGNARVGRVGEGRGGGARVGRGVEQRGCEGMVGKGRV